MSEPRRFGDQHEGVEGFVGDLVRSRRREVATRGEVAVLYHKAMARARTRRRMRPPVLGLAAVGVATALVVVIGLWPRAVEPGSAPKIAQTMPDSSPWLFYRVAGVGQFESKDLPPLDFETRDGERRIAVGTGILRVEADKQPSDEPLVFVSPHLRVAVLGTRFTLTVEPAGSMVELFEGQVRVESPYAAVTLVPGDSIRSDDPRLARPTNSLLPRTEAGGTRPEKSLEKVRDARESSTRSRSRAEEEGLEACRHRPTLEKRLACLAEIARGDGLAASAALYQIGSLSRGSPAGDEEAIKAFRQFERRFPDGFHAREVSLGMLEILSAKGRCGEAQAVAESFLRRFPSDPRAADVTRIRVTLREKCAAL